MGKYYKSLDQEGLWGHVLKAWREMPRAEK